MVKNIFQSVFIVALAVFVSGCGTILPNKLIYEHEDSKAAKAAKEKKTPNEVSIGAKPVFEEDFTYGQLAPVEVAANSGDDKVLFGSGPAAVAKRPIETAPSSAPKQVKPTAKGSGYTPPPRPLTKREIKNLPPINVEKSDKGHNALTKAYDISIAKLWDEVLDLSLAMPLIAIDKSSGVIITDWVNDSDLAKIQLAAINPFGDGFRVVRFRFTVRMYDLGSGRSEVTVVPFAQVLKNRRWVDGKPSIVITEKLMRKIINRLGN